MEYDRQELIREVQELCIKFRKEYLHITQMELSEMFNTTPSTISNFERGSTQKLENTFYYYYAGDKNQRKIFKRMYFSIVDKQLEEEGALIG